MQALFLRDIVWIEWLNAYTCLIACLNIFYFRWRHCINDLKKTFEFFWTKNWQFIIYLTFDVIQNIRYKTREFWSYNHYILLFFHFDLFVSWVMKINRNFYVFMIQKYRFRVFFVFFRIYFNWDSILGPYYRLMSILKNSICWYTSGSCKCWPTRQNDVIYKVIMAFCLA